MSSKYKHLFFDLDHTLWDFDTNAKETLLELYDAYSLSSLGICSAEKFIDTYTENNHNLWRDYHNGLISKEQLRSTRFRKTFADLSVDEQLIPDSFEEEYVTRCPTKTNLFPGTHETLAYLSRKYTLHVITNGFSESSDMKLRNTDLYPYFTNVFISEVVGFNKPDIALFRHALETAQTTHSESIMIGDSLEADIIGAKNAGMDQVFFNPNRQQHDVITTYEIHELPELINLF